MVYRFQFQGAEDQGVHRSSRKGVEKGIARKKAEIAENKFLDVKKKPDPIKFHAFAKEFLEWARVDHQPSSRQRERSNMRSLEGAFQNKNIHEITAWEIEKWKQKRKGEDKPPSVNRELAPLKSILNKAVEWGKPKESPTRGEEGAEGIGI